MPPACVYDGLTIDANCCIKFTLDFTINYSKKKQKIDDSDASAIKIFIYSCPTKNLSLNYYPLTKEESFRNLSKAVFDLFARNGIKNEYIVGKYLDIARKNLKNLFCERLNESVEKCIESEIQDVRSFFMSVEKNVCNELNLQYEKQNIPEEADCQLIACIFKEKWNKKAIVSGDGHFEAYMAEICSNYRIYVFPTKNLIRIMRSWGWSF